MASFVHLLVCVPESWYRRRIWVSMTGTRICAMLLLLALTLVAISLPSHAWLYDGGNPTISGPLLKDGSSTVWVSQPFEVSRDSWVTSFGAAVARGFGTSDMGFNLCLTDARFCGSTPVLASGTILPSGAGYFYRYVNLSEPVRLDAGQKYYLTLAPNSNNFMGSVSWSYKMGADYGLGTGNYGESWFEYRNQSFSVRVDGYSAVPEADCWLTMLVGTMGIAAVTLLRLRSESQVEADRA